MTEQIIDKHIYREGDYWRWSITTDEATYVDGGNHATYMDARDGLHKALTVLRGTNPRATAPGHGIRDSNEDNEDI